MTEANLIPVFIAKMREHVDSQILVNWYEKFLSAKTFPITLDIASEHRHALEICANLFHASQETTGEIVFEKSTCEKPMVIVSSLALFTAIDLVLADFVKGDVKEKFSDLFNDALFRLCLPRASESRALDRALLAFFAKIFVPLGIAEILPGRDFAAVADENLILALLVQKQCDAGLCTRSELESDFACLGVDAAAVARFAAACPEPVRVLLRSAIA